ncbi:vacuolar protein sorting 55, putative [Brugia malayi]|uniref:Vacuolar protein sorting 55, putative n=1 Tax=Brugia malayi TaxID=6279 RepID=A0A4E9F8E1_BRUMA|nr:vacuolar protein sorting 55, putative [Brugia malayi]VIO93060.1 vacuolar protein sorting 55, putative [Brugia malayi]
MAGVRVLAVVLLALSGVVGLTLLVLGCALPMFGIWWPLFVVIFYVLAPIPLSIARRSHVDMTGTSACIEFALFITTGIVVSAFALPMVLAHAGVISGLSYFFVFLANIVCFGAVWIYFKVFSEDGSQDMSLW